MNADMFRRVKAIFDEAVDLPPNEREAFVRERCAGDEALREGVLGLLRHDVTGHDVLSPATPTEAPTSADAGPAVTLAPGTTVAHFTIESVLGVGGFGVVYRARQQRPSRDVALKLIRPGVATPRTLRRFELEAELLARLQHPGIAQVYETGTLESGAGTQPYFVMELIEGSPLDHYVRDRSPSVKERLALFASICDAVHHAHSKGILHRDLKPSNILITAEGRPKILDFGVARAIDSDLQLTTIQTEVGQLIGTVPYMSPEQAAADPAALDTRSDVYTLGVILYELLAGRLPYDMHRRMIHEAIRVIREEDPTRLSSFDKVFRGDIETIVGKALEKQPDRRYQSAADLGADVRRYLDDEPIVARPPSRGYQFRKFARRNRALVGGVLATFVVLVAGVIGTSLFAVRAEAARRDALEARDEARDSLVYATHRSDEFEQIAAFYSRVFGSVNPGTLGDTLKADVLERFEKQSASKEASEISPDQLGAALERANPTAIALGVIDRNLLRPAGDLIPEEFGERPLVAAALHGAVANAYQTIGLPREAVAHLERELALRQQELGLDDDRTLASTWRMAEAYARLNRFSDARPLLVELAERWAADPTRSAEVLSTLASVLVMSGDMPGGERAMRQAVDDFAACNLSDSVKGLRARFNLATILWRTGRVDEALEILDALLEDRRRVLGPEDDETLRTLDARAVMLAISGRLDEAERDFRAVLETTRRTLGDDHPQTHTALTNLGSLLRDRGRPDEALPLMREASEGLARSLGPDNRNAMVASSNVASLLLALNRFEDAEAESRRLLSIAQSADIAPNDFSLELLRATLGAALWNQGAFDEAEPILLGANASLTATLGAADPRTLRTAQSLAEMYEAWDAAEPGAGHDEKAGEWRARLPEAAPSAPE